MGNFRENQTVAALLTASFFVLVLAAAAMDILYYNRLPHGAVLKYCYCCSSAGERTS
jgi:hypothetical protein